MQRVPRDYELLHRLYVTEGQSAYMMAKEFGVAPITVRRVLRELGIPVRPGQTAATPGRIARGHQRRAKLSKYEISLRDALAAEGIEPVPLFAIDRFNIDLAFPDAMLAVEVDGGNWHNTEPRKIAQDAAKEAHLVAAGWRVVRVKTRRRDWLGEGVDAVRAALLTPQQD